MQQEYEGYRELADSLKSAAVLLNLERKSQLHQDLITICDHLANPSLRIAVFGPFNHGKSTLINAMLGNRTLPIDLIPTTGAAITVKYGTNLRTRIMLVDGTEIYRSGTEILQQFAILDGNRQMRKDVASVEVFCPHSFLETGVEFVDLPGTNDREAQDQLVRDRLLNADLVIQLLDARKLMTLGERENLRDWLLDRGIKTVIFVANFINLLEPDEQKQIQNRLLFMAESFRAELPPGFSNLYRVDALPALRARLKGDVAAAQSSGLAAFETALQNIVEILQQNRGGVRLPRVQAIASQILPLLIAKIYTLAIEIKLFDDKQNAKIEIKQKAANLIKQGFSTSIFELRNWISLPNLLAKYQADAAMAMAENSFKAWQVGSLKKDLTELQLAVVKWLYQAYDFFQGERPEDLLIPFPNEPELTLPLKPNNTNNNNLDEPGSIAVGGGIGWLLGGPVGAAVVGSISYLLNKNIQKQDEQSAKESYHQQVAKICIAAAENYLSRFSSQGLSILAEYEQKAAKVIHFEVSQEPLEITKKREDVQRLQNGFNQLLQELAKANIPAKYQPYKEVPKSRNTTKESSPVNQTTNQQRQENTAPNAEKKVELPRQKVSSPSPQQNTAQNTEKKVELPRQKVSSPPPPKNTAPNTEKKVELPRQPVSPPSPRPEEVEAKFRNWELDEEIARMKAEMRSSGSQTGKQPNQSNKAPNQPNNLVEKDKITRAYSILGLQPSASLAEVKQAYRTLVKKCHPDLFVNQPQLQKQAQEKMRSVNEAYTILSAKNN
ncbi:DnaJ-class molecular chaperone with C-terminal Zn finger domain [Cylindrospermum stagnale PCC 7417]|uniref:DnaJ-class molecular chaperone with C-terminal Zn finger domain n=1 Tax=Cylindrospermum stagnale PCC 7417 TaxID=56107 RepID=K9WZR7_9NOST|nr:dynamin family protein [Cylindrospermum stagnale]AFZ25309.1 DnaJ-class molecular chaperone with C-terminal Zn finger domain [Cylindrospermum stagnale PCC 7417]